VLLLAACYALSVTSISLTVAAAPIVGLALAPRAALATLPISLQILGTMAASLPASLLMGRIGRRRGFQTGLVIGAVGAGVATAGIVTGRFWLFCVGSLGIGALNGFAQLYRFAAADVAPDWRARAISWVLAGGVVAGILGPALASGASGLLSARFAGSYLAIIALYLLVAVALSMTRLPPPRQPQHGDAARPLGAIVLRPRFLVAVLAAMTAYGTMSLIMTATPISMQHAGHAFAVSAVVIQAHVVAMFAPSFFTGNLITRFGSARIMGTGLAALLGATIINVVGQSFGHFLGALVLLGLGWNFLFVAGTTMVASLHRPEETYKVQGLNDVLVFGTAAAGSFAAGSLSASIGWQAMNAAAAPALVLAAGALVALGRLQRTVATPTTAPAVMQQR